MNPDGTNSAAIANVSFDQSTDTGTLPTLQKISSDQKRALITLGQDLYIIDLISGRKVKLTNRAQSASVLSAYQALDDLKRFYYVSNQNDLGIKELFKVLIPF